LLWQLHRLRSRVLVTRIRLQMRARQLERERVARELHDTLLQGVFGLLMRFQSVAEDWPAGQPVRRALEAALDSAETTLTEGRRRISQLRDRADDSLPLSDALSQLADDLARDSPTRLSVEFSGLERPLEPALREEVYGVAAEALMNAFQHAQAAEVRLELRWDARSLHLRVRDDGVGMAAQLLRDGRPAHWGIVGMRERAESIRATLTLASRPRQGTTVALHVRTPAGRPRGRLARLFGRR
jgi:signal transduction histidine kinase